MLAYALCRIFLHHENVVRWHENMFVIHEDYYCSTLIRCLSVLSYEFFPLILNIFVISPSFIPYNTLVYTFFRAWKRFNFVAVLCSFEMLQMYAVNGISHHLHAQVFLASDYNTLTVNRGLWMECHVVWILSPLILCRIHVHISHIQLFRYLCARATASPLNMVILYCFDGKSYCLFHSALEFKRFQSVESA